MCQMHYTPTGKVEKDRSQLGLVFYKEKEPPKHSALTRGISQRRMAIPPGDSNHQVESEFIFPNDALLLSFMPHMHLRGKDFEYRADQLRVGEAAGRPRRRRISGLLGRNMHGPTLARRASEGRAIAYHRLRVGLM